MKSPCNQAGTIFFAGALAALPVLAENTVAQDVVYTEVRGSLPTVSGSLIAFVSWQSTIAYLDVSTGAVTDTGEPTAMWWPGISGSLIAFGVYEWDVGEDLNGDGDTHDYVLKYFDTTTQTATNTGLVIWGAAGPAVSGSVIAFVGRAQPDPPNVFYYDVSTGVLASTGVRGEYVSISGSIIAISTPAFTMSYYDIETQTAVETGLACDWVAVSGSLIAFNTPDVVQYYDIASETLTDTGERGYWLSSNGVSGTRIAFVDYPSTSPYYLVRYHNTATGSTETVAVGNWPSISGSIIAFEHYQGCPSCVGYALIADAPTLESLADLIGAFLDDGSIDNAGIAQALQSLVAQAQGKLERDDADGAVRLLETLARLVEVQAGHHIGDEAASTLLDDIQEVAAGL